jgi:D-alanyl-D-alanine carboxypeptidase (penicillin-binding protein 5/6)
VWLGADKTVAVAVAQDVVFTLPRTARSGLKAVARFNQPVPAPVKKGQVLGDLNITAPGMEAKTVPLIASQDIAEVGFFARVFGKLGYLLHGNKS